MVKKAKVVLSFDSKNKVTAFFVLLIQVDKRLKAATSNKKENKAKQKRNRKTTKDNDTGSLICGPFFISKKTQIKFTKFK